MPPPRELTERIAVIAGLDQPLRRALFELLSREGAWMSRDDAAAALGVSRSLAAFHLDKLAEAGLVAVRFERRTGRSGPGAGRPAKLYRRTESEVTATVPDRHYDLAASILADAIAASAASGEPIASAVGPVARHVGIGLGDDVRGSSPGAASDEVVQLALRSGGYEPELVATGTIDLGNCPFHRLAERHRDLVCGMNLELITGLLDGLGDAAGSVTARLRPAPGRCCVVIEPASAPG